MTLSTSSGTYSHADGEVDLGVDRRTTYDEAERPTGYIEHWVIRGELQASTPAGITTALTSLVLAYTSTIYSIGLYNSGVVTHHYLSVNGTLSGIRIVRLPSFPAGNPGDYTNYKRYEIEIEAEYPLSNAPNLISFAEQVVMQGDGGPRIVAKETRNTPPQLQLVSQQTPVLIIQSGQAAGRFLRPKEPPPLLPQFKNGPDTHITPMSGRLRGDREEGQAIAWSYTFVLPQAIRVSPHSWPRR